MNIPDFDKTSALIKSSAESANSISVVGVSPVLIVIDGGPVDGIGTSMYIFTALCCVIFTVFFYSFLHNFRCFWTLLIFTENRFQFFYSQMDFSVSITGVWVCGEVSEYMCRRFVCMSATFYARDTEFSRKFVTFVYSSSSTLYFYSNTHAFNFRIFFIYFLSRSKWLNHITSPFSILCMIILIVLISTKKN